MAKDLPYFKFFCSEWNDGDITLEDFTTQGVFINVCSYYWSNECYVSIDKLKKRFKHNVKEIDLLFKSELIHNENSFVSIHFLDEQQEERKETAKKNSEAGKASAERRRLAKLKNTLNANPTSVEIPLNANPTIKRREEEKREDKIKQNLPTLEEFIAHAVERKKNVCTEEVRLKYFAWVDNNWSITRNNKTEPIKNWKASLTNTVKYLGEAYKQPSKPIEETLQERIIRLNLEAKANG